jgi:hypothetical protein
MSNRVLRKAFPKSRFQPGALDAELEEPGERLKTVF